MQRTGRGRGVMSKRPSAPTLFTAAPFTAAPLPVAPLDERGRLACLRLIRSENVGPITFRELINHYGGAEAALDALPELSRRAGRGRTLRICPRADAEKELEAAARAGARPIVTIEPGYPAALAAVDDHPPLLYAKGNAGLLGRPILAIVGSRQASAAGVRLARMFAGELGRAGLVIASGLARGIDGAAHEAALDTGTVAVLAGGIDIVYPPEHAGLQRAIGERGCLLAEMPPGFEPRAREFPRRNRIISGISRGVLIIEAARRSGTLITARLANEQGREVFAVPGHPLDPRAEGTNHLIKSGARFVTEAADVLAELSPQLAEPRPPRFGDTERRDGPDTPARVPGPPPLPPSDAERERVLGALGPAPVELDEIARATGLAIRTVQAALMELDLSGQLERHGRQLVSLRGVADRKG